LPAIVRLPRYFLEFPRAGVLFTRFEGAVQPLASFE
jgi:hypothetical protein